MCDIKVNIVFCWFILQGTGSIYSSSHGPTYAPPSYHRSYTPTSSRSGRSHHSNSNESSVKYSINNDKVALPIHLWWYVWFINNNYIVIYMYVYIYILVIWVKKALRDHYNYAFPMEIWVQNSSSGRRQLSQNLQAIWIFCIQASKHAYLTYCFDGFNFNFHH